MSAPRPDAPPPMPTPVRVAVALMALLAVLLLSNAALTWFGREAIVERVLQVREEVTRAEAEQFVTTSLLPYLVIGVVIAVSAVFLPRRQPWARWTGLAAAVALGALTVLSAVAATGVTVVSLLVLVLSIGTATSLLARPTAEWVPRLGGKPRTGA